MCLKFLKIVNRFAITTAGFGNNSFEVSGEFKTHFCTLSRCFKIGKNNRDFKKDKIDNKVKVDITEVARMLQ